jgi:purine-binding chemotaxis protein CheW
MSNSVATTSADTRYLSFSLGEEQFAIPLLSVREVIGLPDVTPVPYTPPYFLGIMNLRGLVISVMDLRQKLAIKPSQSAETAVIICDLNPMLIGVVVDSINSVLSPEPGELSEKPQIESNKASNYITSVYKNKDNLVLVLDIAKTLNVEDQVALARGAQPNSTSKAA